MRNVKTYTILDRVGILTDTFTAATTGICTQSAHGLKNGDMVVLSTTGTLPAGLALLTVYTIIEATTNTFKLSATIGCPSYTTGNESSPIPIVDITGTGTGTHTYTMHDIGRSIDVSEFRHAIVSVHGNGSTNLDLGFCGSIGKSVSTPDACPDFSAASTYLNSWGWLDIVSLHNNTSIDGSAASISMTGSAVNLLYEINVNGMKWINVLISGWSVGGVTVNIRLFND